jgi:hypothetical protein
VVPTHLRVFFIAQRCNSDSIVRGGLCSVAQIPRHKYAWTSFRNGCIPHDLGLSYRIAA